MQHPTITKKDRWMILVTILLAIAFTIPIPNFLSIMYPIFNGSLMRSFFFPAAMIMWIIPFAIYFSLSIKGKVEIRGRLIEQELRKIKRWSKQRQIISYITFYEKKDEDNKKQGTVWSIANNNKYPWTGARFFIERKDDSGIESESHTLGSVQNDHKITVQSAILDKPGVRWRVMVLAKEGFHVELPNKERRRTFDPKRLSARL
ncbi:hypothetical protein JYU14_04520 [Simkania negevensis]|uniref:Uncharacterized protein n=1 Tax=Simkania negevensis TaxID=83561 RepID=A0ABS3AUR2_9BACT|nr:hypothetical protein [Simkania negevensis]